MKRAFTLIEMLAVMTIVCLLAVLVLGITTHARRAACETRAKTDLELIRTALQEYQLKAALPGRGGLDPLRAYELASGGLYFKDPWGTSYVYNSQPGASSYALSSCSRTGSPETRTTSYPEGRQRETPRAT